MKAIPTVTETKLIAPNAIPWLFFNAKQRIALTICAKVAWFLWKVAYRLANGRTSRGKTVTQQRSKQAASSFLTAKANKTLRLNTGDQSPLNRYMRAGFAKMTFSLRRPVRWMKCRGTCLHRNASNQTPRVGVKKTCHSEAYRPSLGPWLRWHCCSRSRSCSRSLWRSTRRSSATRAVPSSCV